ncbi:hypothetical protein KA005_42410 [bacterium]|nr:hypothetical protein [bacterium]
MQHFQIVQVAPARLSVRLKVLHDSDLTEVWEKVAYRLQRFLEIHGLSWVEVEKATESPIRDKVSGKFRQVWTDLKGIDKSQGSNQ